MDAKSSGRALVMLSVAYGLVVGLLGAIGFDRVDLVAVVGAVVLGGLWIVRGIASDRRG